MMVQFVTNSRPVGVRQCVAVCCRVLQGVATCWCLLVCFVCVAACGTVYLNSELNPKQANTRIMQSLLQCANLNSKLNLKLQAKL